MEDIIQEPLEGVQISDSVGGGMLERKKRADSTKNHVLETVLLAEGPLTWSQRLAKKILTCKGSELEPTAMISCSRIWTTGERGNLVSQSSIETHQKRNLVSSCASNVSFC